jgi:hypothetical protein
VLDGLINHILTTPPTVIKAGADESKKGKAAVVPRDVFDADDAPHYPEVRRYLESLAIAEPEDDGELGACSFNSAASVSRASAHPEIR